MFSIITYHYHDHKTMKIQYGPCGWGNDVSTIPYDILHELNKVSRNFCIKNDPIIRDPSFPKPKFKKKEINSKMADWDEKQQNI